MFQNLTVYVTLRILLFMLLFVSEELKIQNAVNDDNPVTKKAFHDKTRRLFYRGNMAHNNDKIVRFYVNGESQP